MSAYAPRLQPEPRRNWRITLDARISRCPGCDDWQFDRICTRCTTPTSNRSAAV